MSSVQWPRSFLPIFLPSLCRNICYNLRSPLIMEWCVKHSLYKYATLPSAWIKLSCFTKAWTLWRRAVMSYLIAIFQIKALKWEEHQWRLKTYISPHSLWITVRMRCYSCKAITSSQWQSHKIKHQQWGAACGNNWKPCFSCSRFPQGVGIFGRSHSREPFLSPATYLFLRMGGSSKKGKELGM